MSGDSWLEYAQIARRLDAVRAEESARTAGIRRAVAEMTTNADALEAQLRGQGGMLTKLATTLRLRPPKLTPIPPRGPVPGPKPDSGRVAASSSGVSLAKGANSSKAPIPPLAPISPLAPIEPALALTQLAGIIDRGDVEARVAATRGEYPALLPGWSSGGRGLLVYGVAALVVLGLQALAFLRTGTETNPIMVLFVIPLICFGLGYFVLRFGSRTRVAQAAPDPPTRLGLLLCFLIGPVAALVVVLTSLRSGTSPG